ncbi:protein AXL2 [Kluyveromyces marxianus]|uniref:Protein AXL2 n=1 Tax=Kluyveromyces marxianus TaxID=4911 RepID=A0ABX6EU80_KLUMA|nr:protein AXL2 [Kluyveromyces marxianus]BAP71165.1 protein AXL2 [Kluyveromyces marxianus]
MKAGLLVSSTLSLFCAVAYASVYEAYPVNKQIPPIARVDEDFQFKISNDTFKSTSDGSVQVSYNAYEMPNWLSFDSGSLTFSGKPSLDFLEGEETRYFNVVLEGTDSSDSSSSNTTCQLVATKRSGISVASDFNLLNLLKNYGFTNGKDALKLSPRDIFNVTFERSYFEGLDNDTVLTYYGRSTQYNAPLPNWVFFDVNNLKFSGTAPVVNSQIAPEMDYSFSLIATDIDGFAAASIDFQIVVGAHRLTTSIENTLVINITDSGSFSYPIPLDYIYLDDTVISKSDLGNIELVNAPESIKISDNYTLTGKLPSDNETSSFQLSIYDKYEDVVYLNFLVESTQNLFAIASFPSVNVTRGEYFDYSLLPSQFTSFSETKVSASFNSENNWLHFQPSNLTFFGEVPNDFDSLSVEIVAAVGSKKESRTLKMIGIDGKTHSHTSSSTSSSASSSSTSSVTSTVDGKSTATATSTSTVAPNAINKKKKSNNTVAIACGVAIPVAVILILLLLLLLWRRRRNEKKNNDKEKMAISSPDPKNPANEPNDIGAENPFSDENTLDSDDLSTEAKRLGTLNAMKLDDVSNSSSITFSDEKVGESIYEDAQMATSRDMLVRDDESSVFDDKYRTSSVYFQNAPSQRKSWRFSKGKMQDEDKTMRQSYASLNTVSTQELLTSELKNNTTLPHDPRKSSLGLRDSVFWSKDQSSSPLKTVSEDSARSAEEKIKSESAHSSMSSDDLIPMKQEDGRYKWVENDRPVRKHSTKRVGSVRQKVGVDIRNANQFAGESPERI